jgi:hypothetical protein
MVELSKRLSLLSLGVLALCACVKPNSGSSASNAPLIAARFTDSFDRATIGADWNVTGTTWSIRDGALRVSNAHNHPIWLKRRLPRNVLIEFDAWSDSPDGDIKCEVYGDGRSYAHEASYTATSYVLIHGGWHNELNVIARMDEHAPDRRVRRGPRVESGHRYHWRIERRGNLLQWSVDGVPMLDMDDSAPLFGPGHEFFGFNNWETELGFDNLTITPL